MATIKNNFPFSRMYHHFRGFIFTILCVVMSASAQAATEQSLYGGSGIGVMRTADMMLPGEISYSVRSSMYEYLFTGPGTELDATVYAGISFGWEYLELGISLPYQITYTGTVPPAAIGIKPIQLYSKLSFTGYVEEGFAAGITFYGSYVNSTPLAWIASGQNELGFELNFSHWKERSSVHFNIGYDILADERIESTGAGSYTTVSRFKAQLGMGMFLNENIRISFSALGTIDTALNENFSIATGYHYIASPKTIITFGTNVGFPLNRTNPQKGYYLTYTYSPNGKYKREPRFKKDLQEVQQQNQRIENKLTELDKKLDEMNSKLESPQTGNSANTIDESMSKSEAMSGEISPLDQNAQTSNGIRVIIINASGKDGMGGKVADMLRDQGYDVVAVEKMEEITKETWIHYNTGHSEAAVDLGRHFIGNQHVVRRDINNADIIIIVGADQVE